MKVEQMNLTTRTVNCLRRAGIHTLEDLQSMDYGELCNIRGAGEHTLEEINSALRNYGRGVNRISLLRKAPAEEIAALLGCPYFSRNEELPCGSSHEDTNCYDCRLEWLLTEIEEGTEDGN